MKKVFSWLNAHKTRLTGYAAVIFGVLQLNFDQVKDLIPEKDRGVAVLTVGIIVAIIGHANANPPPPSS